MEKTNKRIALIDDDPIINLIHTKIITKSTDFQVTVYTNAQQAVEQFDVWFNSAPDQLPDVIFLDINMPVMDGWEFLEAFQKMSDAAHRHCKVFMLTSSIDSHDMEKSKRYQSVYDFISKPLTAEKLNAIAC
jgi:CheY-like chemotaxis protein